MKSYQADVVVIGAGIVGIATAYYLKKFSSKLSVMLVDQLQPMTYTSAQSGENYRNWWSHPSMKRFTEHSIKLMEEISLETNDRIKLTRRGYLLATRDQDLSDIVDEIKNSYNQDLSGLDIHESLLRFHSTKNPKQYLPPISSRWQDAPDGVDVLQGQELINKLFPSLDPAIRNIVHIRNAGMVDSQQMASFMLERYKELGGKRLNAKVVDIQKTDNFSVRLDNSEHSISSVSVVNAAGPFIKDIAKMVEVNLPVDNILQQKVAFPDIQKAIPRNLPFVVDLDEQEIDWQQEDRDLLKEDTDFSWLTEIFPGSIHCRPEGGDNGNWVKLGWAFNKSTTRALLEPKLDDHYPEIVLHGAARLNPALKIYYGALPRKTIHYGGYYTKTKENWPLIGETAVDGFHINGAMSGFGSMAACAGGELCAQSILGLKRPEYSKVFSLERYRDREFMQSLSRFNEGIL